MSIPEASSRTAFAVALLAMLAVLCATGSAAAELTDEAATQQLAALEAGPLASGDLSGGEAALAAMTEACLECAPELQARIWVKLGVVRHARGDEKGAVEALRRAFTLDPSTTLPDTDAGDAEMVRVFLDVQEKVTDALAGKPPPAQRKAPRRRPTPKQAPKRAVNPFAAPTPAPPAKPPTSKAEPTKAPTKAAPPKPPKDEKIPIGDEPGNLTCTPTVRAVEVLRPIPLHCTRKDAAAPMPARMAVTYRDAEGDGDFLRVEMTAVGDAFTGTIPCRATQRLGKLEVLVRGFDDSGDEIAFLGDAAAPMLFDIRQVTGAPPPQLPGEPVPPKCEASEVCPPGMPGCDAPGESRMCEADEECAPGLCEAGQCRSRDCQKSDECTGGATCVRHTCQVVEPSLHVFSLEFGADLPIAGGGSVCRERQGGREFGCFLEGSKERYEGLAQPGNAGSTNRALQLGTVRFLVGYQYLLSPHLSVGGRLGIALLGEPKLKDSRFFPLHAEVRAHYFPLGAARVRPFVALGGGMAAVDTRFGVNVIDCGVPGAADYEATCATSTSPQDPERERRLDAVQRLGPAFIGGALGVAARLGERQGVRGELGYAQYFPHAGGALGPVIGYYHAF